MRWTSEYTYAVDIYFLKFLSLPKDFSVFNLRGMHTVLDESKKLESIILISWNIYTVSSKILNTSLNILINPRLRY
jgi:hypothetical protein